VQLLLLSSKRCQWQTLIYWDQMPVLIARVFDNMAPLFGVVICAGQLACQFAGPQGNLSLSRARMMTVAYVELHSSWKLVWSSCRLDVAPYWHSDSVALR
jgi:hypothetical protein